MLTEGVLVAMVTVIGTIITQVIMGTINNKVVTYRLEQLEKKQDKHNNCIERIYKLEARLEVLEHEE